MKIQQLRYLVEVSKQGLNLSAAAESLHALRGAMFDRSFGRGPRARKGDVRAAILDLLAEGGQWNGYQLIQEIAGRLPDGSVARVQLTPEGSEAANPAFDVTPARLVTGLITERGLCPASRDGLLALVPEFRQAARA